MELEPVAFDASWLSARGMRHGGLSSSSGSCDGSQDGDESGPHNDDWNPVVMRYRTGEVSASGACPSMPEDATESCMSSQSRLCRVRVAMHVSEEDALCALREAARRTLWHVQNAGLDSASGVTSCRIYVSSNLPDVDADSCARVMADVGDGGGMSAGESEPPRLVPIVPIVVPVTAVADEQGRACDLVLEVLALEAPHPH